MKKNLFILTITAATFLAICAAFGEGPLAVRTGPALSPRFKSSIEGFYKEPFDNLSGVFVDREHGEVYVADTGRGEVFIFAIDGTPVFRLGRSSGISSPLDVVTKKDRIYVSEEGKPYIGIFNVRGNPVGRLAPPEPMPFLPGKLDVDDEGNIYAVNKKTAECVVFGADDKFAGTIGEGLNSLAAVAAGADRVYLITPFFLGHAIHAYAKNGEHIMSFEGTEGRGGALSLPSAAKVAPDGNVWVVDSLRGVYIYDRNGARLASFDEEVYQKKGRLLFQVDIDFDDSGMIYILDREKKRLSVFK